MGSSQDGDTGQARHAPCVVSAGCVGCRMSAGHRDALPPGVLLQRGEGAERAVDLPG